MVEKDASDPLPGSGPSVWRRIITPILCALVVTVFALRYYNHQHLERIEAQKMKIKHIEKREFRGFGRHVNISSSHPRPQLMKLTAANTVNEWKEEHGKYNQAREKRDTRLFATELSKTPVKSSSRSLLEKFLPFRGRSGWRLHSTVSPPTEGVTEMTKLSTKSPSITTEIEDNPKSQINKNDSRPSYSGSGNKSHKAFPQQNVDRTKGNQVVKSLEVPWKFIQKKMSQTERNVWKGRLLKAMEISSVKNQTRPLNGLTYHQANPIVNAPQNLNNNRLQNAWDKSVDTVSDKDVRADDVPLRQSVVNSSFTDTVNRTKNTAGLTRNIPPSSQLSLSVFPFVNVPTKQQQDRPSVSATAAINQSPSSSIGISGKDNAVHLPLNRSSTAHISKTSQIVKHENNLTIHTLVSQSGQRQEEKVQPLPRGTSLQEIWDNSVKLTEGERQRSQTQTKPRYLGEILSLQEIWDNSVVQHVEKENLGGKVENVIQNAQNQTGPQVSPNVMKQSTKQPYHNVQLIPEVQLGSADLPPKSMRSKVLEFSYRPRLGKKYAVIGVAVMGTDYNYVFTLPMTVLSWRRIGCECIVLLIGSEQHWVSNPILYFVLKELRRLDPVVLFIDGPEENWVFLSQVSRLFAGFLFDWRGMESTLLITSDTDIWPLTKEMFDMPENKKVISLNSECCGAFKHRDQMYKMLPMCSIVMSVSTWREVLGHRSNTISPTSVIAIIKYFVDEFGDMAKGKVSKGDNDGWFFDQHMVSIRIRQWEQQSGAGLVLYAPRDVGRDRVDRSHWFPYGITSTHDIHVLEHLYQPGTWHRVLPLLRQMYDETKYRELDEYRGGFIRMMLNYRVAD